MRAESAAHFELFDSAAELDHAEDPEEADHPNLMIGWVRWGKVNAASVVLFGHTVAGKKHRPWPERSPAESAETR